MFFVQWMRIKNNITIFKQQNRFYYSTNCRNASWLPLAPALRDISALRVAEWIKRSRSSERQVIVSSFPEEIVDSLIVIV